MFFTFLVLHSYISLNELIVSDMKKAFIIFSILLLFSCKTTKLEPSKELEDESMITKSESYFRATGNEPFWSIDISTSSIQFKGVDKDNYFNAPHVEPVRAMDANVKMYVATTEKGSIRVSIAQNECIDTMSGIKYNYSVTVEITIGKKNEPTIYSGCGTYSIDYRLHDIWVLEELEGKPMVADYFLGELPMLEINSKMANFSGFGGCNRIRGSLFQERELLRFTDILSSKMTCDSKNKEDLFLKALQSTTTYEIKNNRLYLSTPDALKLVFKKID